MTHIMTGLGYHPAKELSMPHSRSRVIILLICALALPAFAQDEPGKERTLRTARDKEWHFFIAPYGWLTGVKGTVVTDGEEIDLEIPFEDFLDHVSTGLMVYFEARRDKIFVAFDGTWAILNEEIDGRLVDLDIEIRQQIYDIRVGYEIHNRALGPVIQRKKFDWQRRGIVDLYVGGRYFRTEPIITILPIIGEERTISSADSRVDPFVGLRLGWDMTYRWSIGFRGDVGGFGIGSGAQFSWQASGILGYRVSHKVSVILGYRILEYDTVVGEGEDRNGTDLRQEGLIIGAGISF